MPDRARLGMAAAMCVLLPLGPAVAHAAPAVDQPAIAQEQISDLPPGLWGLLGLLGLFGLVGLARRGPKRNAKNPLAGYGGEDEVARETGRHQIPPAQRTGSPMDILPGGGDRNPQLERPPMLMDQAAAPRADYASVMPPADRGMPHTDPGMAYDPSMRRDPSAGPAGSPPMSYDPATGSSMPPEPVTSRPASHEFAASPSMSHDPAASISPSYDPAAGSPAQHDLAGSPSPSYDSATGSPAPRDFAAGPSMSHDPAASPSGAHDLAGPQYGQVPSPSMPRDVPSPQYGAHTDVPSGAHPVMPQVGSPMDTAPTAPTPALYRRNPEPYPQTDQDPPPRQPMVPQQQGTMGAGSTFAGLPRYPETATPDPGPVDAGPRHRR